MNDTLRIIAAFVGAGAIVSGLISLCVILTFAFSRVVRIEEKISGSDASTMERRKTWGSDPLGRLMRSSYVFTFLVLRAMPFEWLKRSAAKIGDISVQLPVGLTLWALIPPLILYACSAILLITGLAL